MAATKAKQGVKKRNPAKSRRDLLQTAILVALTLGLIFATPTVLVLMLGLLPTFVAVIVDTNPRKYAARSVGFLNLAGTLPFLVTLWTGDNDLLAAMKIVTNVYAWLVIYAASGMGWLIYLGMPSVAGVILELGAARRMRALDRQRRSLLKEWGKEIESRAERS